MNKAFLYFCDFCVFLWLSNFIFCLNAGGLSPVAHASDSEAAFLPTKNRYEYIAIPVKTPVPILTKAGSADGDRKPSIVPATTSRHAQPRTNLTASMPFWGDLTDIAPSADAMAVVASVLPPSDTIISICSGACNRRCLITFAMHSCSLYTGIIMLTISFFVISF